ncbi:MAG: GlsB/YeaQ/YmgE family stress response membrane protein [Actinomycetota bacterium]
MIGIIGSLIMGAIVGYGGRLVLPGAQDIGIIKTVGLGVISAFIVGLVLTNAGFFVTVIAASLVAALLLWLVIRQGWVKA